MTKHSSRSAYWLGRRPTPEEVQLFADLYPERFEALQKIAKDEVASKQTADIVARAVKTQRDDVVEDNRRRQLSEQQHREFALTNTVLPDVDLNVQGIIALRSWRLSLAGYLQSASLSATWRRTMTASSVPTEHNSIGLYGFMITPEHIAHINQYTSNPVSGLVEMSGKVVEHTDGTLRAECAKVLHLFVNTKTNEICKVVEALYNNYPYIPVTVLDERQLSMLLFRIALVQYERWQRREES